MHTDCDLSSAWLEHHLDMVGVDGSSPLGRTISYLSLPALSCTLHLVVPTESLFL